MTRRLKYRRFLLVKIILWGWTVCVHITDAADHGKSHDTIEMNTSSNFLSVTTKIGNLKHQVKIARTADERWNAQIALVNIGDTNALQQLLIEYRSNAVSPRKIIGKMFARDCDQMWVIPFFAPSLSIDEPSLPGFIEDARLPRLSVDAARIIRGIILRSPVFNADVKAWAESLRERDRDMLRESMREWWKENGERIKLKDYQAVTPPRTALTPSPTPSPMKN